MRSDQQLNSYNPKINQVKIKFKEAPHESTARYPSSFHLKGQKGVSFTDFKLEPLRLALLVNSAT